MTKKSKQVIKSSDVFTTSIKFALIAFLFLLVPATAFFDYFYRINHFSESASAALTAISLLCVFFLLSTIFASRYTHNKDCISEALIHQEILNRQLLDLETMLERRKTEINNEINKEIEEQRIYKELQLKKISETITNEIKELEQKKESITCIINESKSSFPWVSKYLAELTAHEEMLLANRLTRKKRPALKASEEIKKISKEKKKIQYECNFYRHQLEFYENIFPWLEEFKETAPVEAMEMLKNTESDEYSSVRNWLSPDEYKKLSSSEKWQLALDRYVNKKNKSNWQLGIEYERYIGYLYEKKGYNVKYFGAIEGLKDMGRDLIATRQEENLVIQCKRWAKNKTIHEKYIMQLCGSVLALSKENPSKHYQGVFITTTTLSETAIYFAKCLKVTVYENCSLEQYPLIKCNIGNKGDKIYHLPFDLQYDKIVIDKQGEFYAKTIEEAENAGFRHAYKWKGNASDN